jgi:magnesium transporter
VAVPGLHDSRIVASGRVDESVVAELLRPPQPPGAVRPTLRGRGAYVFGIALAAVAVRAEDRVFYQEIDLVLTENEVLTVRKTPPGEVPYDVSVVRETCDRKSNLSTGLIAFHLLDDVAERYLDLLDALDDEIDELEENVVAWPNARTQRRLAELRHDLLVIRRTLAPTREAVRAVADGRVDLESRPLFRREVFPREIEREFASLHDKLLRATESLEFARDLLGAAREYHQAKIATDQNEVTKRLAVIASLLLLPTFIVGVYGQNFDEMPELHWRLGYVWSWAWIVVLTFVQLAFFRWKRWI